jgi:hypothetical protein
MRKAVLASFIAAVGAFSVSISIAQEPQQVKPPRFEVAAIKQGNPQLGVYSSSSTGQSGGSFGW